MSRRGAYGRTSSPLPEVPALVPDAPEIDMPVPDPAIMAGPLGPEIAPSHVDTRAACRLLTLRGLSEAEAANLTAVSAGLAAGSTTPWTRAQLNRILFLRELYASAWGAAERRLD